jgi:ribose-phosphate pyrophosphokinase
MSVDLIIKSEVEMGLHSWIPHTDVELFNFPGGEPHCNVSEYAVRDYDCAILLKFKCNDDLITALVLNDALKRKGARSVSLLCPYLPGARQDRGAPLTAKVYADLINAAGFRQVVVVDPHSDVMPALLNNVRIVPLERVWIPLRGVVDPDTSVLVIPDQGAGKRVEAVASALGYQTLQAFKHRDFKTGKLSGFSCMPIPAGTKRLVMLDDICDGGGTFAGLAEYITENYITPPKLELAVTHGIFSKGLTDLVRYFDRIWTTNSVVSAWSGLYDDPSVEVIDIHREMLRELR